MGDGMETEAKGQTRGRFLDFYSSSFLRQLSPLKCKNMLLLCILYSLFPAFCLSETLHGLIGLHVNKA